MMQLQHITCGPCQKTKGIEKGIGKILQGEGGRNSKSCMKCLLQLIYDRSISIYMKWVKTFDGAITCCQHRFFEDRGKVCRFWRSHSKVKYMKSMLGEKVQVGRVYRFQGSHRKAEYLKDLVRRERSIQKCWGGHRKVEHTNATLGLR